MLNTSITTVRELAVSEPGVTRIFEKLKIDYCCGGGQSLHAACANAGVKVEDVWQLLEESKKSQRPTESTGFQTTSLSELIDHILNKHHTFTKDEMARIDTLMDKVCAVHGANHSELFNIKSVFRILCGDLKVHMHKEERILFPYIKSLEQSAKLEEPPVQPPFGTVRHPVRMMMLEHDTAGDLLRVLRNATSDYTPPADACISFRTLYQALAEFEQDLHQHIHLENNILFPRAIEMESEANSVVRG
jgi:regulator of cell morphogenesis and NO signaling